MQPGVPCCGQHSLCRRQPPPAAAIKHAAILACRPPGAPAVRPPRPRHQHSSISGPDQAGACAAQQTQGPAASLPTRPAPISGAHPAYGGRCTLCQESHFLPCSDEAVAALQDVLSTICQQQRLDYDSCGLPDPRFHLDYLFTLGPGRMLGVLLATDGQGQQHVLKAFSGQITECWHIPGWVGPVAGIINESPVYVKTRRLIEGMSARLHSLEQQQQQRPGQAALKPPSSQGVARTRRQHTKDGQQHCGDAAAFQQQQRQLLKRRRRCLSHQLLQKIQLSYGTSTVSGQPLSLLDVYASYRDKHDPSAPVTRAGPGFVGMPAGVGDCCAPKLLHAAAHQGLTPVAMCEVWFGSAPGTATKAKQGRAVPADVLLDPNSTRQHCRLYGPCDKCCAILGTMLCPVAV